MPNAIVTIHDGRLRAHAQRIRTGCPQHPEYRGKGAPLSESGLYKMVMRSDKPEARKFQDWVTREVLPSVRKTGGYLLNEEARETAKADDRQAMPLEKEKGHGAPHRDPVLPPLARGGQGLMPPPFRQGNHSLPIWQ